MTTYELPEGKDDDGLIARLRSGENQAEHAAADEIERLRAVISEAAAELDRCDERHWGRHASSAWQMLAAALEGTTNDR